jgi:pilus assembly protein CpaB
VSSRRTLILVAAVVIGLVSAYLVYNYANSADDRAQGDAKRVPVLVVKKDIPRGLSGSEAEAQGYIKRSEIQSEFKPATAINDPTVIENKVAVANLATGQVLVDGMFADQIDSQITFAGRVPEQCGPTNATTGKLEPCVAISLQFDTVKGVAGVIVPGDFVNILLSPTSTGNCTAPAQAAGGTAQGAGSGKSVIERLYPDIAASQQPDRGVNFCDPARYLYQSVQVLFVDKTAVPQPGETTASSTQAAASGGLITFAVPPEAAQTLASVDPAQLYLTLLPTNYQPYPLPPLNAFPAALPGEDQAQLTPYGPTGIQKK